MHATFMRNSKCKRTILCQNMFMYGKVRTGGGIQKEGRFFAVAENRREREYSLKMGIRISQSILVSSSLLHRK